MELTLPFSSLAISPINSTVERGPYSTSSRAQCRVRADSSRKVSQIWFTTPVCDFVFCIESQRNLLYRCLKRTISIRSRVFSLLQLPTTRALLIISKMGCGVGLSWSFWKAQELPNQGLPQIISRWYSIATLYPPMRYTIRNNKAIFWSGGQDSSPTWRYLLICNLFLNVSKGIIAARKHHRCPCLCSVSCLGECSKSREPPCADVGCR